MPGLACDQLREQTARAEMVARVSHNSAQQNVSPCSSSPGAGYEIHRDRDALESGVARPQTSFARCCPPSGSEKRSTRPSFNHHSIARQFPGLRVDTTPLEPSRGSSLNSVCRCGACRARCPPQMGGLRNVAPIIDDPTSPSHLPSDTDDNCLIGATWPLVGLRRSLLPQVGCRLCGAGGWRRIVAADLLRGILALFPFT
jgi:hypothetical protein